MCDCFHIAFPNWHTSPSTGASRRLQGPQDESICDDPSHIVEEERPRPQGSSPVEEFPEAGTDTQGGEELYDPLYKSVKKEKRAGRGFGSLFDKRSTPKTRKLEEMNMSESGMIVKTAKEACSEGLVVRGGGKEGLFIQEVRPESPASKNTSVKEGDQIISATVYFEDVAYEDAIQILERAQPYKVEFCLKRKLIEAVTLETDPALPSEIGAKDSSPEMRRRGKTKRQGDGRISWPKFPSFSKGRKSRFKRSHSSSEADEHRQLELSPTTSDTESPIKTQDAVKPKTKKHKMKLSGLRMKGRFSRSVDQADEEAHIPGAEEKGQGSSGIHSPDPPGSPAGESPQVYALEDPEETGCDPQYKLELLSLDTTLKTTDLTAAITDQECPSGKKSPERKTKKKKERSELKLRIMGKEKAASSQKNKSIQKQDVTVQSSPQRLKTLGASMETTEPLTNISMTHSDVSHTELDLCQISVNTEAINISSHEKILPSTMATDVEMSMPKVDLSLDMSEVGLLRQSPKTVREKDLTESYGIRTRGPLGDMGTAKPRTAEIQGTGSDSITLLPEMNIEDSKMDVSNLLSKTKINYASTDFEGKITPTIKLPRVDLSDIVSDQLLTFTDVNVKRSRDYTAEVEGVKKEISDYQLPKVKHFKDQLPKREDLVIPGMEDALTTKSQVMKQSKPVFTHVIEEIQAETVQMEIDVNRVKEVVSKLPGFKLPHEDISGLSFHQEITKTDVQAEKVKVTVHTTLPKQDQNITKSDVPNYYSETINTTTVTPVKLPKPLLPDSDSHEHITVTYTEDKTIPRNTGITIELYKREDLEIPGMEAIQTTGRVQNTSIQLQKESKHKEATIEKPFESEIPATTDKGNLISFDITGSNKETKKGKMPTPGFGMVKSDETFPEIGIQFPKTGISLKIDEIKDGEVSGKTSNFDITDSNIEYNIKVEKVTVSPAEFKLPSFASSKFELSDPELNFSASKMVDIQQSDAELKDPYFEYEIQKEVALGIGQKERKPSMTISKVGWSKPEFVPEVDSSDSKCDIQIQGGKVEVTYTGGDLKPTDIKLDIKDFESKGKESTFKLPTIKLPKLGLESPPITMEVVDVKKEVEIGVVDTPEDKLSMSVEGPGVDIEAPSIDMDVKSKGVELEGQGNKFKMPKFGISLPKVKGPEIDLSLSKTDKDRTLPEAKAEIQLPDAEVKDISGDAAIPEVAVPDVEVKVNRRKFSFPKFGFSKPDMKSPEVDVSLPKVDVSFPKVKIEAKAPEIKIKAPESKAEVKSSPTKFVLPVVKVPKFGLDAPHVTVEVPDVKEEVEIGVVDVPDSKLSMSVKGPVLDIKAPSIDVDTKSKGVELEGQGNKFKMPKFGIALPKVKGPEMDFSLSKTDKDMTLPEAKAEIKVPDVGVKGSPTKFKLPTMKLPKFGLESPHVTVEVPDVKEEVEIGVVDVPDSKLSMSVKGPVLDIEAPSIDVDVNSKAVELEGQGNKFKMPKIGISLPKVKGPEMDFSLSKTDKDMTLPEAKAEIQLPDAEVKGSPTKFKLPTVKLPKFGLDASNVTVEVPDVKEEVEIGVVDVPDSKLSMSVKGPVLDIKAPSIDVDVKSKGVELEGQGNKFKMPKFEISLPKVKGPEMDFSLFKTDKDMTLPEAKAEIQLPDVEVKGSPTKFKLPTMKLPKFGLESPHVTVEVPDVKEEVEIGVVDVPDSKLSMSVKGPVLDIEAPSIDVDVNSKAVELEGQGNKFKMPKFGISLPKVKGPEMDFSLSKTDKDMTLPEAKAEIQLPDAEVKGSPTKFKLPTVKLPKFGLDAPHVNVEVPDVKKEVKNGAFDFPDSKLPMSLEGPGVDVEAPSIDVDVKSKGVELDGQGNKFKMPKFGISLPKVKGPEMDFSLTKTDKDMTLPEAKAEIQIPDVEVKGSPTKFKLPAVKLPKIGLDAPHVNVEVPYVKKEVKIGEFDVPDAKLPMSLEGPGVDIKAPSIDVDVKSKGVELEGQGNKFKMPKYGISLPRVKGPEMDFSLSKTDKDMTLPEAKAEVQIPDVEVKGSPTKFKLPTMKLPKFGLESPYVTVAVPDVKKEVEIGVVDVPEAKLSMSVEGPGVDIEAPSIDVDVKSKGVEIDGQGSKFKMPKFGISMPKVKRPEIDLSLSKTGSAVELPEAKAEVQLPDFQVKDISGDAALPEAAAPDVDVKVNRRKFSFPKFGFSKPDIKGPEVDVSLPEVDISLPEVKMEAKEPELKIKAPEGEMEVTSSPTKVKLPTMKLPKFGLESPHVTVAVPDVKKEVEIGVVDVPEAKLSMSVEGPGVDIEAPSIDVDVKSKGVDLDGQGSKFKMPKFGISMPKVKGPEIDLSLSKTGSAVELPEAKAEVQLPDFQVEDISGDAALPEAAAPDVDVKVNRRKFSFPKFGFSKPDIKGPEVDVSLPEVDISLPEVKMEAKEPELKIKAPEGEMEVTSSPTKFKLPTMKLPKFGLESPHVTVAVPDVKKEVEIGVVDVPEAKLSMSVEGPGVDIEAPSIDVDVKSKGVEIYGQGSKFKMPKFGISMPKVKGPEIDLSLSKTGSAVELPEAKAEVQLPDFQVEDISGDAALPEAAAPDVDVKVNRRKFSFPKFGFSKPDIKGPEVDVSLPEVDISLPEVKMEAKEPELKIKAPEGEMEVTSSPTKFKLPTMKLPKFGLESPHVTVAVPDVKKEVEIGVVDVPEAKLSMSVEGPGVDIEAPSIDVDVKSKVVDVDGQGSKFKMPKFGISMPKVKRPETDLSLSKTGSAVELPEAKAEVQLPDFQVKDISGDAALPEAAAPDVDVKVNRRKFSFPKFGFSKPDIKGPEVDVSLLEVDVSLPEVKMEAKEPELKIKAPEGEMEVTSSPTKFKLPTMKLPKFGLESPHVTVAVPDVKKEVEIGVVDVPEAKLSMSVEGPGVDIEAPSIDVDVKSKGVDVDGQGSKFKMPKFGISMPKVKGPEIDLSLSKTGSAVELPEAKAEVQLPDFQVEDISGDAALPEAAAPDVDVKVNRRKFSFPKFGFSKPDIKGPEVDVSLPEVDISLPEVKMEAKEPELKIKAPEGEMEVTSSPTKFKLPTMKLPKFGLESPHVTVAVPDVKKEVEIGVVDVPEAKLSMSVEGPGVDIEAPSIDVDVKSKGVDVDEQGSKFKMPKFGISMPKVKGPEIDLSFSKTGSAVELPEAKAEVQLPDFQVEDISGDAALPEAAAPDVDVKVNRRKFSFPKFGFSKPDIKGPEVDVSLPEVDISLPEVKMEAKEPELKIKAPEGEMEVTSSPTKFKLPTMKLPKFGLESPHVTVAVPDVKKEVEIGVVDVPEAKLSMSVEGPGVDIEAPSIDVDVKSKGVEIDGQGSKFKMPKFGISMPKVKGPEIDLSFSKTGSAVELPEAKAEVQLPDFQVEDISGDAALPEAAAPDVDVKVNRRKFSFPKFGFSKPDIKGPEVDVSLPEVDISLPEVKMEAKEPELKIKAPEGEMEVTSSPTKFKLPTMKLPKFGLESPHVTVAVPDVKKEVEIGVVDVPEAKLSMSVEGPGVNIEAPSIDVDVKSKGVEIDGQGSKFKMPKFGISMPKVKGPEIDLSFSKTGSAVELPEAKAEVQLPDFQVEDISGDAALPEAAAPDVDVKVNRRKFSFPKFGFSKPDIKGPEVDVSLPEVDISLPEVKMEAKEPELKIKAPEGEMEVTSSPTKFKLPTMKLPKFGLESPHVTVAVPDVKKEVEIGVVDVPEAKLSMSVEGPGVDIEAPSIDVDVKSKGVEIDGQGSKFKMPKFGISMPKVKGPEIDLSLSKTGSAVELPEAKAEVQLPDFQVEDISGDAALPEAAAPDVDVKVNRRKFSFPKFGFSKPDIKGPEVDVSLPEVDISLPEVKMEAKEPELKIKAPEGEMEVTSSPTKFKLPTMKLPKFGLESPHVTVAVPDVKKEVEIGVVDVPEAKLSMSVEGPGVDIEAPSIDVDVKSKGVEIDGQGSKFKMPKFGISMPKVKGPEIDLSLSKTGSAVELPEAKAEVQLPDFQVEDISGDAALPEAAAPDVDVKVNRRKFSFPKFGFSKPDIKGPEVDVSLPEVDISLPEVKMEAKEPELKIKAPEGEMEVTCSPTKFKLPTMKLPKFGLESPHVTVAVPDVKKEVEIGVVDVPEAKLSMSVEEPGVDIEAPSIDVDVKSKGVDVDGQGSKFKMPKFGISMPKVKRPETDLSLSKTGSAVELPEAKAEVQLPDFQVKDISGDAALPEAAAPDVDVKVNRRKFSFPKFGFSKPDIKGPEVDVSLPEVDISLAEVKMEATEPELKVKAPESEAEVKGSPTKFKLPTMKLPKFGLQSPNVTVEVPDVKKVVEMGEVDVPQAKHSMSVKGPGVDIETPSIEVDVKSKGVELEGQGSKFKMPKFGISLPKVKGPEIDVTVSKTDIDVTLPEAKAEVQLPDVEVKDPFGGVAVPDVAASDVNVIKRRISFPKFGFSKPDVKQTEVDVSLPERNISVAEQIMDIKEPEGKGTRQESHTEVKDVGSPTRFKMPTIKFPKFGSSVSNVTAETHNLETDMKAESPQSKKDLPEQEAQTDERMKTEAMQETDSQASPSKFKLPAFNMQWLSVSKSKLEDSHTHSGDSEEKLKNQETEKGEKKSPLLTMSSFGDILKVIDVEFDVPTLEEVEEKLTPSMEGSPVRSKTILDAGPTPEKSGWFKFPNFGRHSPSESPKVQEKESKDHMNIAAGDSVEDDVSLTLSLRSSDAFADISSTVTSEQVAISSASPTKVMVKYTDPNATVRETKGDVITSTARTELISLEPHLPEKITIPALSSTSSSSVDTLKLESGEIHVITSNIQATPEAQQVTVFTDVQMRSATKDASGLWSGESSAVQRHVVREASGHGIETVVLTERVTHVGVHPGEAISDETASSIRRLKDTVHSEKMKFFDGTEK
ncbi:neuroblast differentiation-associated protein AHNAK-like isoform X2 [Hypomesus transpacificus]|uniref:neuroblast differentiation-associated protein AHNAK-like isoform X2 n=1 Tax=Hypomesus transpacificus TaxID=137520 RepID=UPI001F07233E|nr:neuroblast differentiation-associated protein AHNAK-like isoform X2 [Hypomesus transpacificus]